MYYSTFSFSVNWNFCQLLLISGGPVKSELNMRPPAASNGLHLEAILACTLYPRHGRHLPRITESLRPLLKQGEHQG